MEATRPARLDRPGSTDPDERQLVGRLRARARPRGPARGRRRTARSDREPEPRTWRRRAEAPARRRRRPGSPPARGAHRRDRPSQEPGDRRPLDDGHRPPPRPHRPGCGIAGLDPGLRDADAPQEDRPQGRVGVLQAAGSIRQEPASDDLVEGAEPGDARDRRCRSAGSRPPRPPRPGSPAISRANRSWSAFVSAWKARPAPSASRNSRRAIVRWPANVARTVRSAASALAIGSVSAATARSTFADELVGRWSASARGRSPPSSGSGSRRRPCTSPPRRRSRPSRCRGSRGWRTC